MSRLYPRLCFALMFIFITAAAIAQQRTVTGRVTDESGAEMPGVNVVIKGTTEGTATDADGRYSVTVSDDAVLVFSFVGYASTEVPIGGRSVVDVTLEPDVTTLQELVVTGYTVERKADIIGAVAVVDSDELLQTPTANLSQQLQARAPGVVASGAGAPGEAAKVRIRGFTSFGSSDPLYVIDGVPTSNPGSINPNDIESIQVLKDATSASIYGARAAQGVVIVTTKKGTPGKMTVSYDGYAGASYIPEGIMPDLLNTREYLEYLRLSDPGTTHALFGLQGNIDPNHYPDFYVVSPGLKAGFFAGDSQVDPALYTIEDYSNIYQIVPVSDGTNWFKEMTQTGIIQNHQITAAGGTETNSYSVALNYFDQEGTYKFSGYDRYALRLNTSFKPTDFITFGENVQVLRETFQNATGNGARGEASAWAQSFRMVPYIPVYDIGGGWGGNGIGNSGNGTNPVAQLYRDKDDQIINWRIFGNVFADINILKNLTYHTSFGIDYGNFFTKDIVKRTYERAENVGTTALNQSYSFNLAWTFTNTLAFTKQFGDHEVRLLAGTEAVKANIGDGISTQNVNTFDFEDPSFVSLNTDQAAGAGINSTQPQIRTLASIFGRVDYTFNDKYLFNATVRRDGSSAFGLENRYGVFPSFGVGWRLSEESFMQGVSIIGDLKIRAGWGQMGSERNAKAINQYTTFRFNPGLSNYDINRSQTSTVVGYAAYNAPSQATKWETSESTNIGFDASLLSGKLDVSFNWFNTDTKELLVGRPRPPLGGILVQPEINLGKMRNRGIELAVNGRGEFASNIGYDVGLTFTHYTNTAIDLDGNPETFFSVNASRLNNVWRTEAGHPVSSFYGYVIDGFFNSQADLDAIVQSGEAIGSWRFKDIDGDGEITDDDRTFIGSPHPDFIMGISLGLRYGNFDFNTFLVWNYGNEIFNYTKYWTDMRVFIGGVSKRVLYEAWDENTGTGTLPTLDGGYSGLITSSSNDYYIESGSYLRGRTLQIGYNVPSTIAQKARLSRARIYVQAQNYFTITKYSGPDPDIGIQGGDLSMGLDDAAYPNPRQVIVGLNLSF